MKVRFNFKHPLISKNFPNSMNNKLNRTLYASAFQRIFKLFIFIKYFQIYSNLKVGHCLGHPVYDNTVSLLNLVRCHLMIAYSISEDNSEIDNTGSLAPRKNVDGNTKRLKYFGFQNYRTK